MFAQGRSAGAGGQSFATSECAVPHLADLSDIVDAAPETVSRVFASMRDLDFLQDRRPQKARFSSRVLQGLDILPGMSAPRTVRKLHLAHG